MPNYSHGGPAISSRSSTFSDFIGSLEYTERIGTSSIRRFDPTTLRRKSWTNKVGHRETFHTRGAETPFNCAIGSLRVAGLQQRRGSAASVSI
jgi:hypothetical protein